MKKDKFKNRLPLRPEIELVEYRRQPTNCEINLGYGATHYASFTVEACCHPGTRIAKRWFKASDGLRYYR